VNAPDEAPSRALDAHEIVSGVRAAYARRLEGSSCCGAPAEAAASTTEPPSFGCGDPTAIADIRPGERVLDLGSGAGLDALRAAAATGPAGRVIGVDTTPAMLERARTAASRLAFDHVTFVEGLIEDLPVADASIDVVLSNCVINLSIDKARVFREVERVLAPGGRLRVSDVLVHGAHAAPASLEGWCACIDGAVDAAAYVRLARRAGLVDVAVDPDPPGVDVGATYAATVRAEKADVHEATADEARHARALLERVGLPVDGWDDPRTRRWVLVHDARVQGAIGVEEHGGEALVRSLAVEPTLRGRGFGGALLAVATRDAARRGSAWLYGLTLTIPDWLTRLGFVEIERDRLPADLFASAELRGACPASARVFALDLEPLRRIRDAATWDADSPRAVAP
jgi:arsenite methyltransferase